MYNVNRILPTGGHEGGHDEATHNREFVLELLKTLIAFIPFFRYRVDNYRENPTSPTAY